MPGPMRSLPLLVLVSIALAVAGCTQKADDAGNMDDNTTATPPATNMTTAKAVSVSLVDQQVPPGVGVPPSTMGINPGTLELKVGERVNLTITNDGNTGHDLVIEGLDVDTDVIPPGESVSVEFTPMEAGTYKMYCSVGAAPANHEAQGMVGEVVVS